MCQPGVIPSMIIWVFLFTMCSSTLVRAGDIPIENIPPAHGFSEDWVMAERVALYTRDTLFDHVNGEAELYFPYGFESLATATYMNRTRPEVRVVADVYRMASLLDAFGIYSNYRKADAEDVKMGAEGFISSSQLMFYQDRYFVRIQVTGATSLEKDIFFACGQAVSKNIPLNAGRPRELDVFVIPGIGPKSERYVAQNILGYAFFRRGITADATLENERVQIFVVYEESPDLARKAFDQYHSYLKEDDQKIYLTRTGDTISIEAVDPLYGAVFVELSGRYIIGAVRLKNPSAAKELIGQLRSRLN